MGAYLKEGSDAAFHALVRRHVGLVYSAAFRQLGDRTAAEEVSQNVFIALARKAPRLAGCETLAGWLHRSAVLEAKARIRSDLRRRRREEASASLPPMEAGTDAPADERVLMLDEALLDLREVDRVVLMLRFFEELSLREVGAAIGVDEEAARKRVARALDRLQTFFRRRGMASASSGAAAALAAGVMSTPPALAESAAAAGLAAGTPAGPLAWLMAAVSRWGHIPAGVSVAVVVAWPVSFHWNALVQARAAVLERRTELAASADALTAAEDDLNRERTELARRRTDAMELEALLVSLRQQASMPPTPGRYRWEPGNDRLRVPKDLLRNAPMSAVTNRFGKLDRGTATALQFSDAEASAVQAALDRLVSRWHQELEQRVQPLDRIPNDFKGDGARSVRGFSVAATTEVFERLRSELFEELGGILDAERLGIFRRLLGAWMPIDNANHGFSTVRAFIPEAHRFFLTNDPRWIDGRLWFGYAMERPGFGSMRFPMAVDDMPTFLQAGLNDWIEEAKLNQLRQGAK